MDIRVLKFSFMEKFMQIQDKSIVERLFKQLEKETTPEDKPWMKFAGILDADEADKMIKDIEEGCENIEKDEW